MTSERVGFGGGCHWCTEAVFQHLRGVEHVAQGWASGRDKPDRFAEAVLVDFDPAAIPLSALIAIHLHTHACTSAHPMRHKYRSAVYGFGESQLAESRAILGDLARDFEQPIITEVVAFGAFRQNTERYLDYYRSRPEAPFCRRYISPKLAVLRERFAAHTR